MIGKHEHLMLAVRLLQLTRGFGRLAKVIGEVLRSVIAALAEMIRPLLHAWPHAHRSGHRHYGTHAWERRYAMRGTP
jgi:hypothetical protein